MIVKALAASAILTLTAAAALADSKTGTIVAFDRQAKVIVFKDKTIFTIEGSEAAVPEGLKAGDRVEMQYETAGEDGLTKIDSIKVVQ